LTIIRSGIESPQTTTISTRYLVVDALLSKKSSDPIEQLSRHPQFATLSTRDRAFCRRLLTTVQRRKGQIEKVLDHCQTQKNRRTKEECLLQTVLAVGAAQLLFLETPAHAAVKETVDVLRMNFKDRKAISETKIKFVNALLRRLSREGHTLLEECSSVEDNAAPWLIEAWKRAWGEEATHKILEASMMESPRCITVKGYIPGQEKDGLEDIAGSFENATILPQGSIRIDHPPSGPISDWPGYEEGTWWLQGVAATIPAMALYQELSRKESVQEQHVVDLCASPGGKTAQLSSYGFGSVTAVEISNRRSKRLKENKERLIMDWDIHIADASQWQTDRKIQGILADVPCTATGTASKRPDVLRRDANYEDLLQTQFDITCHAIDNLLGVGGCLVYATCSLLPNESENQVKQLLKRKEGSKVEVIPFQEGDIPGFDRAIDRDGFIRVIPGVNTDEIGQCDGFFVAKLRKIQ
jgi:16S rRNA (cytosine967-C5)-methyltransferase